MARARSGGRTVLTPDEVRQLLASYDLPVLDPAIVCGEEEAVECAERTGYPVCLELAATRGLPEGNQVRLTASNRQGVRQAALTLTRVAREHFAATAEVCVTVAPLVPDGCKIAVRGFTHPDLGPVVEFGEPSGRGDGPRHATTCLPPLTPLMARELIEENSVLAVFRAGHRTPADECHSLERFLINFSRLVAEQDTLKEVVVDPVVISAGRVVGLAARVVLHEVATDG
jgi:acetyltransferase